MVAADNAICVHQKLLRPAWRDFRCHVRREALDLARLVSKRGQASVSYKKECRDLRSAGGGPRAGG